MGYSRNAYMQVFKELREDRDMTQKQIAELLGTSQTMYARYERGANDLPLRHFVCLCNYYSISADAVLGTGSKHAARQAHGKEPPHSY